MAKHRGGFTEETIKNRIKEGRGFGKGNEYLPWITVREVPSQGKCFEICGWKINSTHQLLSDLETRYFYTLEFSNKIIKLIRGTFKKIQKLIQYLYSINNKSF